MKTRHQKRIKGVKRRRAAAYLTPAHRAWIKDQQRKFTHKGIRPSASFVAANAIAFASGIPLEDELDRRARIRAKLRGILRPSFRKLA